MQTQSQGFHLCPLRPQKSPNSKPENSVTAEIQIFKNYMQLLHLLRYRL